MTSRLKSDGQQRFVNGMEVSGIDPQIVREEQHQHTLGEAQKPKLPSQYGHPSQQIFNDPAAFQSLIAQSTMAQPLTTQHQPPKIGGGHLPRHAHRPHMQPARGITFENPYPPRLFVQNQEITNHNMRTSQVQNAAVRAAASSVPKPIAPPSGPRAPRGGGEMTQQMASETRRSNTPPSSSRMARRRVRLGWTEEETQYLMEGCKRHGVGNWKKILTDPGFEFNCRTAVDLKDRFRTSFPEEYSRLYPNARTHKVKRAVPNGEPASLVKINRKERRSFTAAEDERLLQGFLKHGPAWSKIQRDPTLSLGERRSTDLRDRFRNAFPERYTAAGYKGRHGNAKSVAIHTQEMTVQPTHIQQIPSMNMLEEEVNLQQHGLVPRAYMPQHPMQLQGLPGVANYQYYNP